MIVGPDAIEILEGLAIFLAKELRPTVADPALAFRTLIASNLAATVAGELRAQAAAEGAHRARLAALGFEAPDSTVSDLEAQLRSAVRAGACDSRDARGASVWAHAKASLAEMLAATNPRFDRRADLP